MKVVGEGVWSTNEAGVDWAESLSLVLQLTCVDHSHCMSGGREGGRRGGEEGRWGRR